MKEVSLGAYAHQDVPFEKLVEELQPERSLSHSPLFQVMFMLQNMGGRMLKLTGLDITQIATDSHTAKFDLTLTFEETGGVLAGIFEYKTDLFDALDYQPDVRPFSNLCFRALSRDPDQRLSQLCDRDWRTNMHAWSIHGTTRRAIIPESDGVHHLFESQVERTPDAIAVRCEGRELTYSELNRVRIVWPVACEAWASSTDSRRRNSDGAFRST